MKEKIAKLIREAFDEGGLESLRRLDDLFAREIAAIRRKHRDPGVLDAVPMKPEDREKYAEIIGESPAMLKVFALIDKVAPSTVPVLIQGESGTGKELIARAIHNNSPRKDKDYVTENCAAIPETLLESELFGYKRGAFTGADRNKKGLFEVAHKGTLFLDEIGDMSLGMQKKLLRVLQDGEIRPVGGNDVVHVDTRIISASNKNLQELVNAGQFREDLFFRLNTITIPLPPLRDRKEDIPRLADFFLTKIAKEMNIASETRFSEEALEAMMHYRWTGNIRELENEVRRGLALKGDAGEIGWDLLSDEIKNG